MKSSGIRYEISIYSGDSTLDMVNSGNIYIKVKGVHAVTSIKQSPLLKGHLFLVPS